jgi:hypothetical protein
MVARLDARTGAERGRLGNPMIVPGAARFVGIE